MYTNFYARRIEYVWPYVQEKVLTYAGLSTSKSLCVDVDVLTASSQQKGWQSLSLLCLFSNYD
jgi:hypothetical protein